MDENTEKKVCEKCGKVHETPLPEGSGRGDEWKIVGLSIAGIALLALVWIWVFRWGVPLVEKISQ